MRGKYEISFEEIDVDIYVPYYSKLAIPVEDIKAHSTRVEGFTVAKPEALLILKQGAELNRKNSVKGTKDQIDIMSLLCFTNLSYELYFDLLKEYNLKHFSLRLKTIIKSFKECQYLNLNPRESKLKKKEILKNLSKTS